MGGTPRQAAHLGTTTLHGAGRQGVLGSQRPAPTSPPSPRGTTPGVWVPDEGRGPSGSALPQWTQEETSAGEGNAPRSHRGSVSDHQWRLARLQKSSGGSFLSSKKGRRKHDLSKFVLSSVHKECLGLWEFKVQLHVQLKT